MASATARVPPTYVDPLPERRAQLDGLRVLALAGVLLVHFWLDDPIISHTRVSLFFLVTGFLITLILLRAKEAGPRPSVANFYIRRGLRLLPPLIIMIGLAAYFDAENARESIHWHALQLSNVYFSLNETWDPWVFSHLWSLNVVEQFYIFWPLVILFLPRSTSVAITVALLIVPPLLRAFTWNWYDFLPLWAFDPIAAGALLAFFCQSRFVRTVLAVQWGWLPALVILFSPLVLGKEFGGSDIFRLAATAALIVILAGAYHGYRGPFGRFLGNPLFQALSQISYGIYIYHKLVWWLMMQAGDDFFDFSFKTFLVMSALTIVAAQVSWWLVEAPLARLKARFPVHRAVPSDRLRAA